MGNEVSAFIQLSFGFSKDNFGFQFVDYFTFRLIRRIEHGEVYL